MKTTTIAATLLLLVPTAAAEERIDRKIDEAAGRLIAERIGELRPGFGIDHVPDVVRAPREGASQGPNRF